MKTGHKVLIAVFSVLFVVSVAALALSFSMGSGNDVKLPLVSDGGYSGESVENLGQQSLVTKYPIVKSDFDNIYYSINPDGSVEFYEFNGGSLSKYTGEVKTILLKPACTYYKIPINIYYIEVEGKTLGYGLFTTENSDAKVNLYSYVFAKLTDAPAVYGFEGKMLLLSTDPDEAYSDDKTYTEIFEVNMAKKKCSTITAQRDRNADKTGRLSERWSMLTDSYLASVSKKAGMISGRIYDESTEVYAVFDLNKGVNKPLVKGMYSTFLRENKNSGLVYIKKTAEGFKSVEYIAEEKTIAEFKGTVSTDFIFNGDWVFDKKQNTFTNLLTGKSVEAKKLEDGVTDFAVNSDGSKIVAVLTGEKNQALCVITSDGKTVQYISDNISSSDVDNLCFANSSTVFTTAVTSDGACVNYFISVE
ncbi:MAG: hypothetical protein IJZ88_05320 [Clostridia bacterium]|nr:hypothetical protein [Clostridia bacterium]